MFYCAARSGRADVIKALIKDGRVDPNAIKEDMNSILEALPIQIAYVRGQSEAFRVLLEEPRVGSLFRDTIGNSDLFIACAAGDTQSVKQLLANTKLTKEQINHPDAKGVRTAASLMNVLTYDLS